MYRDGYFSPKRVRREIASQQKQSAKTQEAEGQSLAQTQARSKQTRTAPVPL
jgi:uncharacterized protein YdaU (DUF1376 family)